MTIWPRQNVLKIRDTLVFLLLGDIQLCPSVVQHQHHLQVKALLISQRLLQLPPLGNGQRPVRRRQLLCKNIHASVTGTETIIPKHHASQQQNFIGESIKNMLFVHINFNCLVPAYNLF